MYNIPDDPPPYFYHGPSILARFVFFILLSFSLLMVDSHYGTLEITRKSIAVALTPLQKIADFPSFAYRNTAVYFESQNELAARNEALMHQLIQNNYAQQRLESLQEENTQLKVLLAVRPAEVREMQAAEIVHTDNDPFVQKLLISKGDREGIDEGAAVLDAYGVIGQVTRVFRNTAEVTLVVEKGFMVPVRNERNGKRGVLYGAGAGNPMELRFVTADGNPREGDRLVTSGLDNVYPLGLLVAEIESVSSNPETLFLDVKAKPAAHIGHGRYVLVINAAPDTPQMPLTPSATEPIQPTPPATPTNPATATANAKENTP
jgi:rod shape-determining protein MreC